MAHMSGKMSGKAGEINRAAKSIHKGGGDKREAPAKGGPGRTKPADMKGALEGSPTDHNPLTAAKKELHRQHPKAHDDLGPHHGGTTHHRHERLGGMRPGK